MNIVIVDDTETMRKVLRSLCESLGHTVTREFPDGEGLVAYAKAEHPDVICLDYHLPGADGLELLRQLDAEANDVDVVMITASDDPEIKGRAADAGATGFINKLFEQSRIGAELQAIAEARGIVRTAAGSPPPEAADPAPPPPLVLDAREAPVAPRTALVVDDSGSVRLLVKGILEGMGLRVTGMAANGKEAVHLAANLRPALVCMDVDMPVMTGLQALPPLRSASPGSKVVMITGNAGREVVQAAIDGGATGYFLKPVRPAKVEEFVRKLFGKALPRPPAP